MEYSLLSSSTLNKFQGCPHSLKLLAETKVQSKRIEEKYDIAPQSTLHQFFMTVSNNRRVKSNVYCDLAKNFAK